MNDGSINTWFKAYFKYPVIIQSINTFNIMLSIEHGYDSEATVFTLSSTTLFPYKEVLNEVVQV